MSLKLRISAIFVLLCMLFSFTSLSMLADDRVDKVTDTAKNVYVSGSVGNDVTGSGSEEKPYATFEAAYNSILQTGGSIVIMDNANAFKEHKATAKILNKCNGAVYVYGLPDEKGNYPTLDMSRTQEYTDRGSTVLYLGTDTVFYDITLSQSAGALWIAAAFHDLTVGFNVTTVTASGEYAFLTGGYQANGVTANAATDKGCKITVCSGRFAECYLGNYALDNANVVTDNSEFNIYGGTVSKICGYRDGDDSFNASITVNVYGGQINNGVGFGALSEGKSGVVNLYNGVTASLSGASAKNTDAAYCGELNRLNGKINAPEYAFGYCGVQNSDVDAEDKYNVRFLGTVASLGFDNVGFEIFANGNEYSTLCKKVYTSVLGSEDGEECEYTAKELGGRYIFAVAIKDIPVLVGDAIFKVTPFIEVNGVRYYADGDNLCFDKGKYAEVYQTDVKVASLNLLNNNNHGTEGNLIEDRMPRIITLIKNQPPDSIGVQECESALRESIENGIKSSGYVCAQDEIYDGSSYAFKNFIWYNSNTTGCIDSGQLWLSETPNEASKGFGAQHYISMGWALLKNMTLDVSYLHVNTHLYAIGSNDETPELRAEIRRAEANKLLELIKDLVDKYNVKNVILTGDMNEECDVENGVYSKLTEAFEDTRITADTANPKYTFHGLTENMGDDKVIDHCLCSVDKSIITVDKYDVVEKYNGNWLSDHSALVIDLSLYTKKS